MHFDPSAPSQGTVETDSEPSAVAARPLRGAEPLAGGSPPFDARAPEQQQSPSSLEHERDELLLLARARVDELVAPLIAATPGVQRLGGTGRGACIAAYREDPEGFASLVEEVYGLRHQFRRPLGALVAEVFRGHHRLTPTERRSDDRFAAYDR